jgi:hypothetical protein
MSVIMYIHIFQGPHAADLLHFAIILNINSKEDDMYSI